MTTQAEATEAMRERQRCAQMCADLATIWEQSAKDMRARGTYKTIFGNVRVAPKYEEGARSIEAAAHGVRTLERGIADGWVRRK